MFLNCDVLFWLDHAPMNDYISFLGIEKRWRFVENSKMNITKIAWKSGKRDVEDYREDVLDSRYLVEELIGKGGMGVVYKGRHVVVGREVAIKFLISEFATQEDIVTRFYREAQTAAAIGHKNIIDILDVGISERNEPYFVMEYLEGECLATLMSRTDSFSLGAACGILEPVLLAISAAHSKGIVHRDLKPENIFLVHDSVDDSITIKLIDFGISKFLHLSDNEKLTRAGSALGTPSYMSPEQVSCSPDIDHRSDIYSIGVLLYEMLTKETPYDSTNSQELMVKILTESPRNPSDLNPDFPEEARPILTKSMAIRPEDRYSDATEMLEDLRQLDVFSERHHLLSQCALGMENPQCAVGDLGRTIGEEENEGVPARVLTALSEPPPATWPPTNRFLQFVSLRKRRRQLLLAGGAILIVTIFLSMLNSLRTEENNETIETPTDSASNGVNAIATDTPPLQERPPKQVRIDISNLPPRATIVLDGVLVPSNKFYLPRGNESLSLTVDAPGYQTFETHFVPDKNLTITAKMPPSPTVKAKSTKRVYSKKSPSQKSKGYIPGRRKTEIVKEFE